MKYSLITFDVGGVLMRMDRERVAREYVALAKSRGAVLDMDATLSTVTALDNEIPARAKNSPSLSLSERVGENFWKTLYRDGWTRLGLTQDADAIDHFYRLFRRGDFNCLFDDVRPALDDLTRRGLTLGIVSNFTPNLELVLRELGIAKYFSVVAVSAVVRVEKPDRAIFDHAARAAKCAGKEIAHVGDGVHADVEGARNAGWDAILLDRDNWYPDYSAAPRIRTLGELVNWL